VPGPRPKPTHLKIIAGNPGRRPLPQDEPEPDGDLFEAPEHLSSRQKQIWAKCIHDAPAGLLKKLDTNVLERFVAAKAIWEDANTRVAEMGTIVNNPAAKGQFMRNPFLNVMSDAAKLMRQASDELGFSPAARTRVKVSGKKKGQSAFGKLRNFKID
jgi:P27 family predicted phage terminase small subunit